MLVSPACRRRADSPTRLVAGELSPTLIIHAYVCTHMAERKVNKTFSLPLNVVERLEQEDNQSETVEKALKAYWNDD